MMNFVRRFTDADYGPVPGRRLVKYPGDAVAFMIGGSMSVLSTPQPAIARSCSITRFTKPPATTSIASAKIHRLPM